jgi:predicted nuclease with TOPRIM domain
MFGLGGKVAAGMGIALLVVSGAFYWYYDSSQARIETLVSDKATLTADKARLTGEIEEQQQSIARLEATRQQDQERILELSQEFNEARDEVARLRATFSRHDLNRLSLAKPGLIENIINRGTAREGREFIELTTPPQEVPEQPDE